MAIVIGVQIGQGREPTAIAVADVERRAVGEHIESHFAVRFLDRLPPRTTYPAVVERLVEIVAGVTTRSGRRPTLNVDATAADPVLELLHGKRLEPVACHFNHGGRRNRIDLREVSIGKGFLVVRLKVLLQTGRLHLATPKSRPPFARSCSPTICASTTTPTTASAPSRWALETTSSPPPGPGGPGGRSGSDLVDRPVTVLVTGHL